MHVSLLTVCRHINYYICRQRPFLFMIWGRGTTEILQSKQCVNDTLEVFHFLKYKK